MSPHQWQELSLEVVRSNRGKWPADRQLESGWFASRIQDFDLWYVFAGKGSLSTENGIHSLKKGTIVCLKAGKAYEAKQDESSRLGIANIHFRFRSSDGQRIPPQAVDLAGFCLQDAQSQIIDAGFHRVASLYRTSLAQPAIREECMSLSAGLLRYLLLELRFRLICAVPEKAVSNHEGRYRLIDRFIALLQDASGVRRSMSEVARQMGYTPEYLIRIVKRETGMTPKAIVLQMRVQEAKELLDATSLNISEIAEQLGYHDVFSFSQQFKHKTGHSPTAYRKKIQEISNGN